MSAVGTTLLQSPGWNEGKARNETLGKQRAQKIKSSVGAALQREHLPYVSEVPPLWGSKCIDYYYPGLAPWAMKSVALAGLIYVIPPYQLLCFGVRETW